MSSKTESLRYEYVHCALCGEDNTKVKYKIRARDSKLSGVWINGLWHQSDNVETIVACKTCGLVYVNPRLSPSPDVATYSTEQELAYFDRSREFRLLAYRSLIRRLSLWLGRDAQTLLDIGCGDGVLVEAARETGIESAGTEISDMLISVVRGRLGEGAIISGNLADLPADYYDVITIINVLEHLRDPAEMLKASARLLKSDGILLAHTPNLGGLPARLYGAAWYHVEPLEHFYYFTARTLMMLMQKVGLRPIGRFNLVTSKGLKGKVQHALGKMGIYLDNGLGIIAQHLPGVDR